MWGEPLDDARNPGGGTRGGKTAEESGGSALSQSPAALSRAPARPAEQPTVESPFPRGDQGLIGLARRHLE